MLRRLALVPLAALGVATAFLISGAGGATLTSLVRLQPAGIEPNDRTSDLAMNADGSCLVGTTEATNIPHVSGSTTDSNGAGPDVFFVDRDAGTFVRLTDHATNVSVEPSVSDDCNLVAYTTFAGATGLTVVRNMSAATTQTIASLAVDPQLSGDGQFVVYRSTSSQQLFRVPSAGGSSTAISVDSNEIGANGLATGHAVSADGNRILFGSHATNLVAGDTNGAPDVFLRDVTAGTTELVSVTSSGTLATGGSGSLAPALSRDGTMAAFETDMPTITGSVGPFAVVRDLDAGTNTVAGPNFGTLAVNDDGTLAFVTPAALDPADTGTAFPFDTDAYLVETPGGAATWLSRGAGGTLPAGGSVPFVGNPVVSNDGSVAGFTANRTNLVAGDGNGEEDAFVALLGGGSPPPPVPTPTPPETPTPPATPPPDVVLPGRADLVVTKTASKPAAGESFAPGEAIVYTIEVVNAGTRDAVNVLARDTIDALQLGTGAPDVTLTIQAPPECSQEQSEEIGGPLVASTMLSCDLGTIAARGGRRSVTYTVRTGGDRTAMQLSNGVETFFATNDADESDNTAETTVDVDTGERECEEQSSCESPPGTTTTTCEGESTVCRYGGEGVMNTVCRGDAVCGGGPERETHVCSGGATCKDRLGEPNVFRCSGEDTYCAGVGRFLCTDGARCVANGESTGRCEESKCSWGENDNENVVCVESDCWLNGGDDDATCLRDSTCKYGPGNDDVDCRSGSSCFAGTGRDEVDCVGDETSCNTGRGRDDATCTEGATCLVWGSDSEVTCDGGRVRLNAPGTTMFMTDCTVEACDCPRIEASDFYVNRQSKAAARRLRRPDLRFTGQGTVVAEGRSLVVRAGNRKPNIATFGNVEDGLVVADEADRVRGARTRVILDNFDDTFPTAVGPVFDREQHPWYVPNNLHVITVEEPAARNASFGVIRIPVERVRPGGDVGVVLVPENVPRGFILGGTVARTDAAIGENGLGAGSVVVRTHIVPHVFDTKGRSNGRFSFDFTFTAANASGITGVSADADDVRVGVYLFDEASGRPLTSSSGAPCGSCAVMLGPGRKASLSVDNIASASRTDLSRLVKLGYAVLTVDGRAEDVKLQGFVVNAHTSPFDLSVFGFAPEEIRAPATP